MDKQRKYIQATIGSCYSSAISPEELEQLHLAAQKAIKDGWKNVYLVAVLERYDTYVKGFDLVGERLETDEEFSKRVAKEEARESDSLKRERKEYERLKKKFGG